MPKFKYVKYNIDEKKLQINLNYKKNERPYM